MNNSDRRHPSLARPAREHRDPGISVILPRILARYLSGHVSVTSSMPVFVNKCIRIMLMAKRPNISNVSLTPFKKRYLIEIEMLTSLNTLMTPNRLYIQEKNQL